MSTFTGTNGTDYVRPDYVSTGVIADPSGSMPGSDSDTIYGNGDIDYIDGADGNDLIYPGAGNDNVQGGAGDDYISEYESGVSRDSDLLAGGSGNDTIYGYDGDDKLYGENGNDFLYGGWLGDDTLDGGAGADYMEGGGADSDTYYVDNTGDIVVEEPDPVSSDIVYASITYTMGPYLEGLFLVGIDAINGTGNELDNGLGGNDNANNISGGAGLDSIYSRGGNDRIDGGSEADSLDGGSGTDIMAGGSGDDRFYVDTLADQTIELSNDGLDSVISSVNGYVLGPNIEGLILEEGVLTRTGNNLANTINGNEGDNSLFGAGGNDGLVGMGGNDQLHGDTGADIMYGQWGDDFYYVDNAGDQVIESGYDYDYDTVYSTIAFTLGTDVESIYLTGSANANATGNATANQISGNSFVNVIRGLAGVDTIQSGNGADTVIGGTGNDIFRFQSTIGSSPSARDTLRSGDGAVAFERPGGQLGDQFDLTRIDANTSARGTQHFAFGSSHSAGRLWAVESGDLTLIRGNTDGDTAVEFEVAIQDGNVRPLAYTAADFLV